MKKVEIDMTNLDENERGKYYAMLQSWFLMAMENTSKSMTYYRAFCDQVVFIRDEICGHVLHKYIDGEIISLLESLDIVSTHVTKSITLPVYKIVLKDFTKLVMRENFHGWIISVESEEDVVFPLSILEYSPDRKIEKCFCEGFDESWVYGCYSKNKKRFTIAIDDNYKFYMFIYLLAERISNKLEVSADNKYHYINNVSYNIKLGID